MYFMMELVDIVDKIDWTGLKIAEDYYVTLQLLTMGYQNKISLKYRVDPMKHSQRVVVQHLGR